MSSAEPFDFSGTAAYAPKVLALRLDILYRRIPMLMVVDATFSASAMLFSLWFTVPQYVVFIWLATLLSTLLLRATAYIAYRRLDAELHIRRLAIMIVISLALSGALWGAFFEFLFYATPIFTDHFYIFFFLGGIGIASMSALSVYLPAFYMFFLPPMLLVSGISMAVGEFAYILLGAVGVAYAISLSALAKSKNAALIESLSLRFQLFGMARRLSEQRDAAERANIAKSKFLAAASHDLRQPLHALTLLTTALDESAESPRTRNIVVDIKSVVGSLEKLFNALLDISRLDAGVLHPDLRHFNVATLVSRLVGEYAPTAHAKGLSLVSAPCNLVIHSDPTLLERILRNYISNAVRYTDSGGVSVACTSVSDEVRIAVTDTGIGISHSQQAEIFNEFFQIGNPERDRTKGLGLGLAIVRRIAELLRHPIGVDSTPGRGARFTVTVPRGDPGLAVEENRDGFDARFDLTGLCVVVIDDDTDARNGTRTLLTLWGCEVVTADDEDGAVTAVRERGIVPAALLVDYRLRNHRTGLQAIERLQREVNRSIPALIISGDTAPERLREVAASGYALAHKPVQPAVLRAFLQSVRSERAA